MTTIILRALDPLSRMLFLISTRDLPGMRSVELTRLAICRVAVGRCIDIGYCSLRLSWHPPNSDAAAFHPRTPEPFHFPFLDLVPLSDPLPCSSRVCLAALYSTPNVYTSFESGSALWPVNCRICSSRHCTHGLVEICQWKTALRGIRRGAGEQGGKFSALVARGGRACLFTGV